MMAFLFVNFRCSIGHAIACFPAYFAFIIVLVAAVAAAVAVAIAAVAIGAVTVADFVAADDE